MVSIEDYNASLDEALIAFIDGNHRKIIEHKQRFNIASHPNPFIERMSLLKAITSRASIPMNLRTLAKRELSENNMHSWDDGDVPT